MGISVGGLPVSYDALKKTETKEHVFLLVLALLFVVAGLAIMNYIDMTIGLFIVAIGIAIFILSSVLHAPNSIKAYKMSHKTE